MTVWSATVIVLVKNCHVPPVSPKISLLYSYALKKRESHGSSALNGIAGLKISSLGDAQPGLWIALPAGIRYQPDTVMSPAFHLIFDMYGRQTVGVGSLLYREPLVVPSKSGVAPKRTSIDLVPECANVFTCVAPGVPFEGLLLNEFQPSAPVLGSRLFATTPPGSVNTGRKLMVFVSKPGLGTRLGWAIALPAASANPKVEIVRRFMLEILQEPSHMARRALPGTGRSRWSGRKRLHTDTGRPSCQ